jgi:hypothetical protein
MTDLIKRLEEAEAGSRELDAAIADLFNPVPDQYDGFAGRWPFVEGSPFSDQTPPVTTSLDAALALAERVLPGWGWEISHDDCNGNYYAWVGKDFYLHGPQEHLRGIQESPALALCIAVLKATDTGREG